LPTPDDLEWTDQRPGWRAYAGAPSLLATVANRLPLLMQETRPRATVEGRDSSGSCPRLSARTRFTWPCEPFGAAPSSARHEMIRATPQANTIPREQM